MAWREDPARCRLAEEAARRAAAGLEAGPVLTGLRRLTIAGLLADGPAPRRSQDLAGIARAVCGAADQAARRRPGWLYAMVPPDALLPVAVHRTLLQAALLSALRGCWAVPGPGACCSARRPAPGCGCGFRAAGPTPTRPTCGDAAPGKAAARRRSAAGRCSPRRPGCRWARPRPRPPPTPGTCCGTGTALCISFWGNGRPTPADERAAARHNAQKPPEKPHRF